MHPSQVFSTLLLLTSVAAQDLKAEQLQQYIVNDVGQAETNSAGDPSNSTYSIRVGPRGYVLLQDNVGQKKLQHFTRERQPERVVHASGHGAYGYFTSYGDWSNYTSACWLQANATSDTFSRFSVHNVAREGSEVARDTHGFATKIYSECGNQDLVFNHVPSFFLNDGIMFSDMVHAIKPEPDKGFPTGGGAHQTAYDFFTLRPEASLQRMMLQSDLGIPIDSRHMRGNGVHTFRFINSEGKSSLFKWYWEPLLGLRSRVDDEASKIVGYNGDYFRTDMYYAIENGLYPEWELKVQIFPDDGTYMYKGIDLLDCTLIVPWELNPPLTFGKLTLNRNPTNYFSEVESLQMAPANTVTGISNSVPDAVLQWRIVAYDDTATYRHGSPNYNQIPVNCPLKGAHNNQRDGMMQIDIDKSGSEDSPNALGDIYGTPESALTNGFTEQITGGPVGRYGLFNDAFPQATTFFYGLDPYAQQHIVDAFRSDMNKITNQTVNNRFISLYLNQIDNCLARRVAYGIGAPLPELGSGTTFKPNTTYPSSYPIDRSSNIPIDGLTIGVLADDDTLTLADYQTLASQFQSQKLNFAVIAPRGGKLQSGVVANGSYTTGGSGQSVFYDAVVLGSGSSSNATAGTDANPGNFWQQDFLREAWVHGKPLVAIGNAINTFNQLGYSANSTLGIFAASSAQQAASDVATSLGTTNSLGTPGRYPMRMPLDDVQSICGTA
ncbi:MAG: hypothetical protein M1821_009898 [Bathelium mastoideum]|nr:MAG: hypothetical protein M1821_009898 [Bathelium mastoideum]